MAKDFIPSISVEKMAAYLDKNLPAEEMERIDQRIHDSEDIQQILIESENIHPLADLDTLFIDPLDNDVQNWQIPIINPIAESWELNNINPQNESTIMAEKFNEEGRIAATKIYGEDSLHSDETFDPVIYQGNEGVCAIRSQQIVLRDYGIDISLDELKAYAIEQGWYDPSDEGGTPMWAIGNLLEVCGVHNNQSCDNTVYDLVNELAQGHRIIVGVDANELWASRDHDILKNAKEWFNDFFVGDTPNHALIVAGVQVNPDNPTDIKVILTDPGQGDLRIEYSLEDFMDAWEDSHCFMVSTDSPAPLQYNELTGRMEPSNFAIEEFIDANSLPLNANNIILPEEMTAICAGPYYSDGHISNITIDGVDINYEQYNAALANSHAKYKAAIGIAGALGQDHFDKESFVTVLKNLLHINIDSEEHDTHCEDNYREGGDNDDNDNNTNAEDNDAENHGEDGGDNQKSEDEGVDVNQEDFSGIE